MENTEIIKALRWCGGENNEWCVGETYECPLWNEDRITDECKAELMTTAADALEEYMKKENALRSLIDGRSDPVSCNVDAILMGEYE